MKYDYQYNVMFTSDLQIEEINQMLNDALSSYCANGDISVPVIELIETTYEEFKDEEV